MSGDLIFYVLAALTVIPAFWVVMSKNLVHSGFALLFTLVGISGLYGWLGADFIAVTQLMVYVGGVLVLVLFTVMMTRVPGDDGEKLSLGRIIPAGVFALGTMALLYKVISGSTWNTTGMSPAEPTTAEMGVNFMTNYIFPFEYVSLVLLSAMIGAALLIREKVKGSDDEEQEETEVQS